MAGDHLAVVSDQNRVCESKPGDALGDLFDLLLGVSPRVARVGLQVGRREVFDLSVDLTSLFLSGRAVGDKAFRN